MFLIRRIVRINFLLLTSHLTQNVHGCIIWPILCVNPLVKYNHGRRSPSMGDNSPKFEVEDANADVPQDFIIEVQK